MKAKGLPNGPGRLRIGIAPAGGERGNRTGPHRPVGLFSVN